MRSLVARVTVFLFVGLAMVFHSVGCRLRGTRKRSESHPFRVFLIGAFDSAGWLTAHAGPLVKCHTVDEVHVICDEPVPVDLPGICFHCPSARMRRVMGRGLSRIYLLLRSGWELRPEVFMGYHIMPNAPLALLAAGLCGGKAIYQMTGGPIQVIDGGYQSENPLLRATGSPSKFQEKLLLTLLSCFDVIVVRGKNSVDYLRGYGLENRSLVITGAIDVTKFHPATDAPDRALISIARLVKNKGVEQFLMTVRELGTSNFEAGHRLVGDGPARMDFEELAKVLEIDGQIHFSGKMNDVVPALRGSRMFVLLSPSEGMSIAMLEAMACGLPPVVLDVGDLSDAVIDGYSGLIFQDFDAVKIASRIREVLLDPMKFNDLSANARKVIVDRFSVESIADRWDAEFRALVV